MTSYWLLHAGLPGAALSWLWWRRPTGSADALAGIVFVLGVLAVVSLAVPSLVVPVAIRYVYLVAWGALAVWSWMRRSRPGEVRLMSGRRLRRAGLVVAMAGVWSAAGLAVDGRRLPAGAVLDLACPLGPGTYLVVNGGSRLIVNAHLATLSGEPRLAAWRGQSYGVDLVEVDGFGRRARSVDSINPGDYFIYGQQVIAPCDGAVGAVGDGRPDMPVGVRDRDRSQLAGNFVILGCGPFEVLLGHLQPGSLRVAAGDVVRRGDLLAFAGNSGNTDEPHLHVSVQLRVEGQPPFGGDPIWSTVGGAFLVRNDRLACAAGP